MWLSLELVVLVACYSGAAVLVVLARRRPGRRQPPPRAVVVARVEASPRPAPGAFVVAGVEASSQPAPNMAAFSGPVWIVDGDSVEVNRARIRLFGMDAPELSQRGGYKARAHLIRIAGGKTVRVVPMATDRYGRIVARVWLGETDLSARMVRDGFAVAMRRWHADYVEAESQARRDRAGLWADDPVQGISDPAAHRRQNPRRDAATRRGG
jgi:endonuclease YncB( thermonuclease family)